MRKLERSCKFSTFKGNSVVCCLRQIITFTCSPRLTPDAGKLIKMLDDPHYQIGCMS